MVWCLQFSLGAPLRQKVVNDAGLSLWKGKGLDTWPTVAITLPKTDKVAFVGELEEEELEEEGGV